MQTFMRYRCEYLRTYSGPNNLSGLLKYLYTYVYNFKSIVQFVRK